MVRSSREDLDDRLMLELDGPGLEPGNVSPLKVLELAASFFSLVDGNAHAQGVTLELSGLEILNKCVAVAVRADNLVLARRLADLSRHQISGREEPPQGFRDHISRARAAMRHLSAGETVRVQVGAWSRPISSIESDLAPPLDSWLAVRAMPIRIGGKQPVVRLESALEDEPFSLRTTHEMARTLGPYLYRAIDIEARISRDFDGLVATGELVSFDPVDEDADPVEAWRGWYREDQRPTKD